MSHFLEMLSRLLPDSGGRLGLTQSSIRVHNRQVRGQAGPEMGGWHPRKVTFVGSEGDTALSWSPACCCLQDALWDPSTRPAHPPLPACFPLPEAPRPSPHHLDLPVSWGHRTGC